MPIEAGWRWSRDSAQVRTQSCLTAIDIATWVKRLSKPTNSVAENKISKRKKHLSLRSYMKSLSHLAVTSRHFASRTPYSLNSCTLHTRRNRQHRHSPFDTALSCATRPQQASASSSLAHQTQPPFHPHHCTHARYRQLSMRGAFSNTTRHSSRYYSSHRDPLIDLLLLVARVDNPAPNWSYRPPAARPVLFLPPGRRGSSLAFTLVCRSFER